MNSIHILEAVVNCFHGVTFSHGLYAGLFIAGLIGGFTHCVAMCGPFVFSRTGKLGKISQAHILAYHLGRLTTYTSLAILFSGVLNIAFLFLPSRSFVVAPILFLAAIIFLVHAFESFSRVFPWGMNFKIIPYRWVEAALQKISQKDPFLSEYLMGVILGFVPCGLIVSALMAASTAPSAWQAGMGMSLFGLGTVPALLSVSFGGGFLQKKYPAVMRRIMQGMMVWSGFWLMALAGLMLI